MENFADRLTEQLLGGDEEGAIAAVEAKRGKDAFLFELGQALLALHRKDGAALCSHAQKAHEAALNDPQPLHYLLIGHALQKNFAEAERCGRHAIHLGGGDKSRVALGSVLAAAGKLDAAEEQFQIVLRKNPKDREAMKSLAALRIGQQDLRGAILQYALAFSLDPADPGPMANLTELLVRMGKLLGAMEAARLLLAENPPKEVQAVLNLSVFNLSVALREAWPTRPADGEPDQAVRALLTSGALQPPPVRLWFVRNLIEARRSAEARELLAPLLDREQDDKERAEALFLQGLIAEQEGSFEEAFSALWKALKLDPARGDVGAAALSFVLDHGAGDTGVMIETLLSTVRPEVRAHDPRLLLQEARYKRQQGQLADARRLVVHAQSKAQKANDENLEALCQKLLDSL